MRRRFARRLTLTCTFALSLAGGGEAPAATPTPETHVKADVEQIVAVLREQNYAVEVATDAEGLPFIKTDREKRPFRVYFYDCDGGVRIKTCLSVQFYAAFTLDRPFPPERMNEWNRSHRFGRGYIDSEKDPAIEMDVNLAAGGLPAPLFKDTLDLWIDVFTTFDDFVFDTPDPDKAEAKKEPEKGS